MTILMGGGNCGNFQGVADELNSRHPGFYGEVFNRYKPIFLAIKNALRHNNKLNCVNITNAICAINRISRASKTAHVPMRANILNAISAASLADLVINRANIVKNAKFYQIARALQSLNIDSNLPRLFTVRNGKSFVRAPDADRPFDHERLDKWDFLLQVLAEKFPMKGLKVYVPHNVAYSLPTSEKNYVGNIPMGTKFFYPDAFAVGVAWWDHDGAMDLDLGAISTSKIGWDGRYRAYGEEDGEDVSFSGDITSARDGAVEYLRFGSHIKDTYIITNNVFTGAPQCKFSIVLGSGCNISYDYMMDPNKTDLATQVTAVGKDAIIGCVYRNEYTDEKVFVIMNVAWGNARSSCAGAKSLLYREACVNRWKNSVMLEEVLSECGAVMVASPSEADVDLSVDGLKRDTFTRLFS